VAYKEEFMVQYNHYLSLLRLQTVAPAAGASTTTDNKSTEQFAELITFVSQVAQCYPETCKELPKQLSALLLGTGGVMMIKGDLRQAAVKNMIMLRNKEVIDSIE
jgi:protein SDA1